MKWKVHLLFVMAKKKSESLRYITIHESDYYDLIRDHIVLKALKLAGVENLPLYKGVQSIIDSGHSEIHIIPIQKRYK